MNNVYPYVSFDTHHIEEDGAFRIAHVDGYTANEDVEGVVLARIVGIKTNRGVETTVLYRNNHDRGVPALEDAIAQAKANVEQELR